MTVKLTEYRDKLDRTAEKTTELSTRVYELDNRIHEIALLRAEVRRSQSTLAEALASRDDSTRPTTATSATSTTEDSPEWIRYWDPTLHRYMFRRDDLPPSMPEAATSIRPPPEMLPVPPH